ncbi:MAG: beta-ketoacyl-ACP reductase [Candidatus Sungbacteria bacterium RIFCSPHIGHO2_02_FULL_52_23]|uniref:Beta-ketoacyl-ACP reductase n=1 Tax=Candidatus Sungbacteria bacterium RIFCSPHIGHO2_02_FULL_52_23 TaxID=1802274 RepID=A0A1G2KYF4_9BACT|nr:MAG: beta-ketoacyl-ACP reductase [Candidatus Sungbacteria bacterium RIFCSPHIGHO2_02_FULL_52_23]
MKQKKHFGRKVAVVTGAERGIGRAVVCTLAAAGMDVVIVYHKDARAGETLARELDGLGMRAIAVRADVSDFASCRNLAQAVKKEFGRCDVLVNNAGVLSDKTLAKMSKAQWDLVIRTNLDGVFNVTKHMLPLIREGGAIINISSIIGTTGNFGQTNYAASKAGIIGFTKSLSREMGRQGITVNAIAPGLIDTAMIQSVREDKRNELIKRIPAGRMGTPEEVAYLVAFLASPRARYISGAVIGIDGGLTL